MTDFPQQLEQLLLLTFLVSSMFGVGLRLSPHEIISPLRNLALVLPAARLNFVLAPAFAWLLTMVIPLDRGYATGLLLIGCAAGSSSLPQVVEFARADLSLAIPLMALLTFGTILFLPFGLPLMVPGLRADPWTIARPLLILVVLPLCAGMLVKKRAAAFAARIVPVFGNIGHASLLLFAVIFITLNLRMLIGVGGSGAILVAFIYFAGLFAIGWLLAGSRRPKVRGVMGLATTGRNFGVALVPAAGGFHDPKATAMIVVGAIVCFIVSLAAAGWLRRITPIPHAG